MIYHWMFFFDLLDIEIQKDPGNCVIDFDKFNTIFKTNLDDFGIFLDRVKQTNTSDSVLSTAYILLMMGCGSDDAVNLLDYYKSKIEIHDIHTCEYILY